jgi:hypothetical protein
MAVCKHSLRVIWKYRNQVASRSSHAENLSISARTPKILRFRRERVMEAFEHRYSPLHRVSFQGLATIIMRLGDIPRRVLPKDTGQPDTQHSANTIAARLLRTLHIPSTHRRVALALPIDDSGEPAAPWNIGCLRRIYYWTVRVNDPV